MFEFFGLFELIQKSS